jgi:AbrB family looped-hinge helix DNA binding protein
MISKLTIDKAGRIVVPKPIREELHIQPGDTLEIETHGEEIKLRPVRARATMRKKRGVWVFDTGAPLTSEIVEEIIRDVRKGREEEICGGDS